MHVNLMYFLSVLGFYAYFFDICSFKLKISIEFFFFKAETD